MNIDDRLTRAAEELRRSVANTPAEPHRILRRRRRAAVLGATTVVLAVAVLAFNAIQDETQVATRSQPPATRSPADGPQCRPPEPVEDPGDQESTTVVVYFFCRSDSEAATVAVPRRVSRDKIPLRAALEELLKGPTDREREAGFLSVLRSFGPDLLMDTSVRDGVAFVDLSEEMPRRNVGGGTAFTGSFFRQFDPTVFQFPEIQEIVYRINGDAEQFCHMFEITCEPVTRRPAPTSQPGENSG